MALRPVPSDTMPVSTDKRAELERMITAAARFLPPQGPIDAFVAQNMLQGFDDQPFEEAVVRAAWLYDAEPFLAESHYRAEMSRGRIRSVDLDAVLASELGPRGAEPLAGGRVTLAQLHRTLLLHPVRQEGDAAVRWTLTESNAIERLRIDLLPHIRHRLLASCSGEHEAASDLWHACVEASSRSRPSVVHLRPPVRHRDLILAAEPGLDIDELVHPLLIRMVAAYLDQGVASWPMPDRERGMLHSLAGVYGSGTALVEPWSRDVPRRLRQACAPGGAAALDTIATELDQLGIPADAWPDYITHSLVALRGWASMVRQLELRPDRAPLKRLPASVADFLAIRLILDRAAVEWACPRLGYPATNGDSAAGDGGGQRLSALWAELRDRYPPRRGAGSLARAFLLHQVSQLLGLSGADIRGLEDDEAVAFESAIAAFDNVARRRLFHLAYERRHRVEVLDALAAQPPLPAVKSPLVQAVFCIDDRCESMRRHLEETEPGVETFGTAGFFAVPMYYRGLDDWHAIPLCPIVMRPSHTVTEVPRDDQLPHHRFRQSLRRMLGRLRGTVASGSTTLFRGGLLTAIGGALAAIPLVARVAFPRLSALAARRAADLARRPVDTRLTLERAAGGPLPDGTQAGFDVDEMAAIVRRLLEDIGLTTGFAKLVAVLGHGSTSLNNPHESAYDCGACGGGRGGPNARAFALMANDPTVRHRLAATGLQIPDGTIFVGGLLDTCTSRITWFDAGRIPASHADDVRHFQAACSVAGALDAQERCRRFDSVPLDVSPAEALRRVDGRSCDLAQVRPEYGHASNAVCIVGRRERTRGLFLDRRAFLVSYDPDSDADGGILERTLAAVGPVTSGINLAYLFSRVDPVGYGAGTKLPHNIAGLIGVMDGHASDLRTGLPLQGVEIHEPVRLVMVIDAPVRRILEVLDRLPAVRNLVVHRWIQLVAWQPHGADLEVHDGAGFVPYAPESAAIPVVAKSASWYRGRRDHLPPARIAPHPPLISAGQSDAS